MQVTPDMVLVRDNQLIDAPMDDHAVILSIHSGAYFSFNAIGSEIWRMLIEPRKVREILDSLSQAHDVDPDVVTRDVVTFLQALVERRLLRVISSGNAS